MLLVNMKRIFIYHEECKVVLESEVFIKDYIKEG